MNNNTPEHLPKTTELADWQKSAGANMASNRCWRKACREERINSGSNGGSAWGENKRCLRRGVQLPADEAIRLWSDADDAYGRRYAFLLLR